MMLTMIRLDIGTIEAETAMFGQPIHIPLASVIIGCRLVGEPHFMSTSIDLISALMKVTRGTCLGIHSRSPSSSISVKLDW